MKKYIVNEDNERPKIESCEECGRKYKEGTLDYGSIFQTGYCGNCLVERVERGEEW